MCLSFVFFIYFLLNGPIWYIATADGEKGKDRCPAQETGYDRSGFIGPILDPLQRVAVQERRREEMAEHKTATIPPFLSPRASVQQKAHSAPVEFLNEFMQQQPDLWYPIVQHYYADVKQALDILTTASDTTIAAAVFIQAKIRRLLARKAAADLRNIMKATKIQAIYRGIQQRRANVR
mmetsp:Transcript_14693/g.29484  ORF Transcript_14693/g.29484 Transcript_14693/m.29484 type:complete len:179 (-) Transcript_14693:248-784(-)